MSSFSDYIVYVDESGDHSLTSIDKNFPVFVLSLCVFHKKYYANQFIPKLQEFKFRHFGHDYIILHERDIRKEIDIFKFLNKEEKMIFIDDLSNIIDNTNFILISCVINKNKLTQRYSIPDNPYNIAMRFCLERLYNFLSEKKSNR